MNATMTKITAPNGRYSIIADRDSEIATTYATKITSVSSTEPQPWAALNFAADGSCIGGRTMSESMKAATISGAAKAGMEVVEA